MRFAIITPSYAPDFDRCQLLCESVERYLTADHRHYLLVDRRDRDIFRPLTGPRTEIQLIEDWLPRWVAGRFPFSRKWWLSLRTLPLRNWIVQQLAKLAVGEHIDADAYLFIDSDTAFIRPFDLTTWVCDGKLRLHRVPGAARHESHFRWHRAAAKLLGLPVRDYFGSTYIGGLVTWRRDHLRQLYQRISEVTGRDWMTAVARRLHFSEYMLYGIFVEHVLRGRHLHYFDDTDNCLSTWDHDIRSAADLPAFFAELQPSHVAVMVSSKLHIPVGEYREVFPFQPVG